ncbi:MAG: PASTA domain-containing protein, partial [Actinomycetia bacterium]|nr:PASTA domain-containing protein [Actinomycetes bacterium]
MSEWAQRNRNIVIVGILILTIGFASLVLVYGYDGSTEVPPQIAVGERSPQTFIADRTTSEFPDPVKTARERELAAANVPAPFKKNTTTSQSVINSINAFFTDLEEGAFKPQEKPLEVVVPNVVGRTVAVAEKTVSESGLEATVGGSVITTDEAQDGTVAFQSPLAGVTVEEGSGVNLVVFRWQDSTTTTSTLPPTTTTTLPDAATRDRYTVEEQVEALAREHAVLGTEILTDFVELHEKDLDRVAERELSVFPDMQRTAISWAQEELDKGIRVGDLNEVKQKYLNAATRPPIAIVGIPEEDVDKTHNALANLVARRLLSNEDVDEAQWKIDKQAARDAVPQQTTSFPIGTTIAKEGDILTSVQVAAIQELGLYSPEIVIVAPGWALAAFGAISILLFALLLYRISPKTVRRIRDVVLLAIILGLAVLAARVPGLVTSADNHSIGYIIPAVAIGVMAAILFNPRTA